MIDLLAISSFHGSELAKWCLDDKALKLTFHNVILDLSTEEYYTAFATLGGVRIIERNGIVLERFELEGETASVLDFDHANGKAVLVIHWVNYKPASETYVRYDFHYDELDVTGEKQDDLIV